MWFLLWPPVVGASPRASVGVTDKIVSLATSSLGAGHLGKQEVGNLSSSTPHWLKMPTLLQEPQEETGMLLAQL